LKCTISSPSRQLPPTRFFNRISSDESIDEEDTQQGGIAAARDVESILGLCSARGIPERMLRWHYRSRHHSLIAVSNQEFYGNELFIVPSPWTATADLGLKFGFVPNGVFDRGGTSTNRIEAKAVCVAVLAHVREYPDLSLGVAAFGIKQQIAILDELELLRRENPDCESFFNGHETEPFFVKNLENVQGDERDVIFVSVGYAKDASGFMAMSFGPLSVEGGERRLNVLITRAKKRCVVFSSITADDIDLERGRGRGVAALKTFLSFAQTGRLSIAAVTGEAEQSPFEEAVRHAIQSLGHEVHPQVGIAGFFIDLAVVDRDTPGRYLLGIECDGATYHSSRSSRDRDRLRQAVLEEHGWIIHRIWSTDWFQRPVDELRKVVAAIDDAKRKLTPGQEEPHREGVEENSEPTTPETVREDPDAYGSDFLAALAIPYIEARFEVQRAIDIPVMSTRGLAEIVFKVVQIEGPIHEDELVTRTRELWGLQRAGGRIQQAVTKAIRMLLSTGRCQSEASCLCVPDLPIVVRSRATVGSPGLRKPEMLPPQEIRTAILAIADATHGIRSDELHTAAARIFGFKATSDSMRGIFDAQMRWLVNRGDLVESSGVLRRLTASTSS
jgi:very-short-patch-repair endonuclease